MMPRVSSSLSPTRRLTVFVFVALCSTSIFLLMAQWFLHHSIARQQSDVHWLNIAMQQRMLSQKVVKCALILEQSRYISLHLTTQNELRRTLQRWNGSQSLLLGGEKAAAFKPLSIAVRQQLTQNEPDFNAMNAAAKQLLQTESSRGAAVATLLRHENAYLRGMEAVTRQVGVEVTQRAHAIETLQLGFFVLTIGVLWLEGVYIFRPATRQIEARCHELERTQSRQRALFEALPDSILVFDEGGALVEANPRSAEAIAGPMEIHFARHLKAAQAVGHGKTFEFKGEESSEKAARDYEARLILLRGDSLRGDTLRGGLAVVRDVTEKKESERLKAEFVSTVSHELRAPLNSMRGALALLSSGAVGLLPPRAKPLVDVALSNCQRLTHLVDDILDLERIQSDQIELKPEIIALDQAVLRAVEANRSFAGEFGVQFNLDLQVRGYVRADGDRIAQILAILLSNAAKFSQRGQSVGVATTRKSDETGRWVRVLVQDNGTGIAPEFRNRIFGHFEPADATDTRANQGSGLGLAVARALTEKLDGRIGFDSHLGQGNTFWVEWRELTV